MAAYMVRRAGAQDVQAIAHIESACFSAPWSEARSWPDCERRPISFMWQYAEGRLPDTSA